MSGQFAEKGVGNIRYNDPDCPRVAALELPGSRIGRIAGGPAEFHDPGIGFRPDILGPVQRPGHGGMRHPCHFGNVFDGQLFHSVPSPQIHREMLTFPWKV